MTLLVLDIKSPVNLGFVPALDRLYRDARAQFCDVRDPASWCSRSSGSLPHPVSLCAPRRPPAPVDEHGILAAGDLRSVLDRSPWRSRPLPVFVYGVNLLALGALLALQLHYLAAHSTLAAADLTPTVTANIRREVWLYALIPLASMAMSFYSPRVGMYLYLLLANSDVR
jgi:hypothetical protein